MNAQHETPAAPPPQTLETRFLQWQEAMQARGNGRACPVCHHGGPCRCADRIAAAILPDLWARYVDLVGNAGPVGMARLREGWNTREVPRA